jgi:hypothetical protein
MVCGKVVEKPTLNVAKAPGYIQMFPFTKTCRS